MALLLHDIGKPLCYTEDENGGHFYGHAVLSRDIAEGVLNRLRLDNRTKNEVLELILYHDSVIDPTPKTVRRWLNRIGQRRMCQLIDVRLADVCAQAESARESRLEKMSCARQGNCSCFGGAAVFCQKGHGNQGRRSAFDRHAAKSPHRYKFSIFFLEKDDCREKSQTSAKCLCRRR